MQTNYVKLCAGPLVVLALLATGWLTRDTWKGWIIPSKDAAGEDKKDEGSDNPERVKLSAQAQKNLGLIIKETVPTEYQRKIYLPGTVIDKPGHSDRGIPAPIAGVVTNVYAVPGKTVKVGEKLFDLKIASESFQSSQMELFKNTRELEIVKKERKRLAAIPRGAVPDTKLLELEYQQERLQVLIEAHRQDLQTRQLTAEQIGDIEQGKLVREMVIRMPARLGKDQQHSASIAAPVEFEVQELKVNLGDHVQAGQILAYLADHRFLYIEGRALRQEAKLLARAAKEGWPVEAVFTENDDGTPDDHLENLTIEFLGNTMDASGLTLPVYVPFDNPHKDYVRDKRTYRTGLYRPGQKVLLKVAVDKKPDVFVLPLAAVEREGAEAYVFRQNGSAFDRRAVHVILEDTDVVVIANDNSITAGSYLVYNAAAALNRALKASKAEGDGGHHHDHD